MARQIGLTTDTPSRTMLGAGKLTLNYGQPSARSLGATAGGAEFSIAPEYYDIPADGVLGATKGLKHIVGVSVTLAVTLLEMTEENLKVALQGLDEDTTPANHKKYTRDGDLTDSDYLANIALLVEVAGKTHPAIFLLTNALQTESFALTTQNNAEGSVRASFMGHYDLANPQLEPWEIWMPTS